MEAKVEPGSKFKTPQKAKNTDDEREIEKFVDLKGRGRACEYLIKWKGLGSEENTWVDITKAEEYMPQLYAFRVQRKKNNAKASNTRVLNPKAMTARKEKVPLMNRSVRCSPKVSPNRIRGDAEMLLENLDHLNFTKKKKRGSSETEDEADRRSRKSKSRLAKGKGQSHVSMTNQSESSLGVRVSKLPTDVKIEHEAENLASPKLEARSAIDQCFDVKAFMSFNAFFTSRVKNDPQTQQALREDVEIASAVKRHVFIDNNLYFTLLWENGPRHSSDKHFFTFSELEDMNPVLLCKYSQKFLLKPN